MEYEYTISDALEVRIFQKGGEVALYYQPSWPNGTEWADLDEAEAWAKLKIESMLDDNEPHAPFGPGEERVPQKFDLEEVSAE